MSFVGTDKYLGNTPGQFQLCSEERTPKRGRERLVLTVAISLFLLAISAGCSGFFINPSLSSIYINPASATVAVNNQVQLIAYGKYSDGSQSKISGDSVSWSSSNSNVAEISPGGLVTGVNTGTATMTASSQGVSSTANVSVTLANITSLVITTTQGSTVPQTTATISGTPANLQFYAYGNADPSNDLTESVTWTSSNTSVATISSGLSGGNGVATSVAAGITNITASTTNSSTGAKVPSQTIALTVQ
jgi:trimeric autotransporter adhesin